MSLPVPLSVRVGDKHVTREVSSLSFRKEAIGGVRNITFQLARPLATLDPDVSVLSKVYVYDARSATTIAQGRLADTGRSANSGGGETWDVVTFGPVQHASDITAPLIYIDSDLSAWRELVKTTAANTLNVSALPGVTIGPTGLLLAWPEGHSLATNEFGALRYDRIAAAGQKLGGYSFAFQAGILSASTVTDTVASTAGDWAASETPASNTWTTGPATDSANITTDFTNGRDTLDLRIFYTGGPGTIGEGWWSWVSNLVVRATMFNNSGGEILTGYGANPYTYTYLVVQDLLGRPGLLDEYDGANATVATSASVNITQLAYPAGVTPAQVLDDMMALEPGYRWYTTPDTTGNGYGFRWELWPTTVRYEATLDDGGSFPISAQSLYNQVNVRWRDETGADRVTGMTGACPLLDDEGLTRRAVIDLPGEGGSLAQATQAGTAFLEEHAAPKNSGSLTVARPIRDIITGAMVQPWEIEAGELVRVVGVEGYNDALNASDNDGQTVFRIYAMTYTSDGNSAQLDLDSDPRDVTSALVTLLRERNRR